MSTQIVGVVVRSIVRIWCAVVILSVAMDRGPLALLLATVTFVLCFLPGLLSLVVWVLILAFGLASDVRLVTLGSGLVLALLAGFTAWTFASVWRLEKRLGV